MLWNKRLFKNINWFIPIATLLLIMVGLIAISSALELNKETSLATIFLQKQIVSVVLGFVVIIIMQFFDYRSLKHYADIIYLCTIGILGLIFVIGQTVSGGKRWINLGPVNFQPSELAKIMLIIVLAAVVDKNKDDIKYLLGFLKPVMYVIIPFTLILLQNDLGTSLVIIIIFLAVMFVGGANGIYMSLVFGGSFLSILLMIVSHLIWQTPLLFLKPYQLNRVIAFIDPKGAPFTLGYQLNQSKIALGSGRLLGKGLFAGTQNQLEFLPESHTDFIFSVIGEEFGFIGALVVILLYLFLLWQIFKVAYNARDNFGRLLAVGVGTMFFFHIFENIGMTMGLMPITGLPLPFISYGGSSMVTLLIAIGLVLNVNIRRKKIVF
ncbi:MAG: rod shape-determining protein RodA [Halothermotrichaceae bacterium]